MRGQFPRRCSRERERGQLQGRSLPARFLGTGGWGCPGMGPGEPLLPRRRRQADNGTGTGSREVIPESGDGDWGPREWGRAQLRGGGEAVPASGAGCGERWGRSHRGCGTERAGPTGDVKSLRTCPGHRVGKEGE